MQQVNQDTSVAQDNQRTNLDDVFWWDFISTAVSKFLTFSIMYVVAPDLHETSAISAEEVASDSCRDHCHPGGPLQTCEGYQCAKVHTAIEEMLAIPLNSLFRIAEEAFVATIFPTYVVLRRRQVSKSGTPNKQARKAEQ